MHAQTARHSGMAGSTVAGRASSLPHRRQRTMARGATLAAARPCPRARVMAPLPERPQHRQYGIRAIAVPPAGLRGGWNTSCGSGRGPPRRGSGACRGPRYTSFCSPRPRPRTADLRLHRAAGHARAADRGRLGPRRRPPVPAQPSCKPTAAPAPCWPPTAAALPYAHRLAA